MTTPADIAKSNAWRAAREIAVGQRDIADKVFRAAELDVIRQLLYATLPGGEAEFWALVESEITRKP